VNPTLRDAVLGAWELVSFVARDATTGEDRQRRRCTTTSPCR
jgi:hypothetical protein